MALSSLARLAGGWIFCPDLRGDISDPAPGVLWQGEGEVLGEGGHLLRQPAFCFSSFLPSACEDVLAFRTCSVSIRGAAAGEAAGKSWNAVLQLGAPQHCLLPVQRHALLSLCIPSAVLSPRSSHATLEGAGGW